MSDQDARLERLRAAAEMVRTSGTLGKSAQIGKLFDFLVERSLAGRTPKEIEVAQEVFDLSTSEQIGHDATVRMSIHRLRKKLEDLPANALGERLVLPRGEYRLQLLPPPSAPQDGAAEGETDPAMPTMATPAGRRAAVGRQALVIVGALALGLILIALLSSRWSPLTPAEGQRDRVPSPFWLPLAQAPFPTLLVCGDRYTFGELDDQGHVFRQLRDPAIPSSEALDSYKAKDPGQRARYVDLNLFDLPSAATVALTTLAPIVRNATRAGTPPTPLTSSRFTTDMLKAHNIVYVGLLSDMRDLHEPIFATSGFQLAPDGDALIDRRSGQRFQSDWADPSQERMLRRDYAYVASFPGPYGNRILVVAAMNDPALSEGAQIVARRGEFDALATKVGKGGAFEALYEVRTFGPSSVASRLVIARSTQVDRQWHALRPG
ncbi:hypothetical protein RN629_14895 [Sphingomonadaceae bacterium jetA1]|uniref:hypothetical protein n=1 Tax=Facivitalis istanbulensis TaxID=3075838 RepID=UPI003472D56F